MPSSINALGPSLTMGKPSWYKERVRSWTNTANYSTTPRSELPINDYSDDTITYTQFPVERKVLNPTTGVVTTSIVAYGSVSDLKTRHTNLSAWLGYDPADSVLINEAALKALVNLGDMKSNLAVTAAEMSKTSSLILGKANQIYSAYRSFRRGDLRKVAGILNITPKKVHKTWLEYKYGWMPLLMDVKGAAELVAQHHLERPLRFSASGYASDEDTKTREILDGSAPYWRGTETAQRTRKFRVKITAEIDNPLKSSLQQMGLTNPLLVAWELVPFSFVFDWFIGVGQWLQGLSALHGLTVRRAMVSRVGTGTFRYDSVYSNRRVSNTYHELGCHFVYESHGRSYTRDQYVVDPLSLYPPVMPTPFNWQKTLTSLALLRAQSRRL